jgi:hypothetical protein
VGHPVGTPRHSTLFAALLRDKANRGPLKNANQIRVANPEDFVPVTCGIDRSDMLGDRSGYPPLTNCYFFRLQNIRLRSANLSRIPLRIALKG